MENKEIQEIRHPLEEGWEERTLNLLNDSKIDQEISRAKSGNGKTRKHPLRWMLRSPMAISEMILELQDKCLREYALRCLSNFLIEKREVDPVKYKMTGYMLHFSCSTMALLLQEVLGFHRLMIGDFLTTRACKRLINVLTLFQCIAANTESRQKFVDSLIPNYLIPIMLLKTSLDEFENVRAVALSVFAILCQDREPQIIKWALLNQVAEASQIVLEIGNELSKVIGMCIIESILITNLGLFYICSTYNDHLLKILMRTLEHLICSMPRSIELFSPHLLFHVLRCCVLLCTHPRGLAIVRKHIQRHISIGFFIAATEGFPQIKNLLNLLLLIVGINN